MEINLMIVSHPDDEIIFGWDFLRKGKWKVICATHKNDERGSEFRGCMKEIGAEYEIWDYEDKMHKPFHDSIYELINNSVVNHQIVATHNSQGEYGHPHHIQIHKTVCQFCDPLVFDPWLPVASRQIELLKRHYFSQSKIWNRRMRRRLF